MSENAQKPRIRFKGFSDAWEQRKLGDIGKARSGVGFPDAEQGGVTGIPFFKVSDMNLGGNENEMTVANNYVTAEQIAVHRWSPITELPAIFFAKVGAAVMLNRKRLCRFPFLLDNNTMAYSLSSTKWDADFAKALFGTVDLTSLVQVGALPSYNAGDVESMEIYLPSLLEQEQIGGFFKQLDNLITLHQRKYDKLVAVKKSLLEKMFPADGETVPKIRFKGFSDAWEQRKLGETTQIIMGQSPDGSTYSDFPTDYILVQGNADLENGWVKPRIWTTQKTKYAVAGDLIMSVRAPAGSMGKTAYNVVLGRGVAAIKGNEFIFQVLTKMDLEGFWKKLSAGSTFESLNSDNIINANINLPSNLEQDKIGSIFENIDNLITLHQRQLEKLKNIKSALLEKMFV